MRQKHLTSAIADKVKLLDVVALTVDLPEYKLFKGQVGTGVDILADGTAYEVKFSDRKTICN